MAGRGFTIVFMVLGGPLCHGDSFYSPYLHTLLRREGRYGKNLDLDISFISGLSKGVLFKIFSQQYHADPNKRGQMLLQSEGGWL